MTKHFLALIITGVLFMSTIGLPLTEVIFPSDDSDEIVNSDEIDTIFLYGNLNRNKQTQNKLKNNQQRNLKFRIDWNNLPCSNATIRFCEEINEHLYPSQHVETILEKSADRYLDFFNKIERRDDFSEPLNLCETYRRVIYPQVAMNVHSDWRFIINQPKYRQPIRVELCQKRSSQCQFSQSFPPGLVSSCSQKYTKFPLLSLGDNGEISKFEYEFPSHCQCDLHRIKLIKNRSHRKH